MGSNTDGVDQTMACSSATEATSSRQGVAKFSTLRLKMQLKKSEPPTVTRLSLLNSMHVATCVTPAHVAHSEDAYESPPRPLPSDVERGSCVHRKSRLSCSSRMRTVHEESSSATSHGVAPHAAAHAEPHRAPPSLTSARLANEEDLLLHESTKVLKAIGALAAARIRVHVDMECDFNATSYIVRSSRMQSTHDRRGAVA